MWNLCNAKTEFVLLPISNICKSASLGLLTKYGKLTYNAIFLHFHDTFKIDIRRDKNFHHIWWKFCQQNNHNCPPPKGPHFVINVWIRESFCEKILTSKNGHLPTFVLKMLQVAFLRFCCQVRQSAVFGVGVKPILAILDLGARESQSEPNSEPKRARESQRETDRAGERAGYKREAGLKSLACFYIVFLQNS